MSNKEEGQIVDTDVKQRTCCKIPGCNGSGCNKLNVYDWLKDISLSDLDRNFNIKEISFNYGSEKGFYRNNKNLDISTGDTVVVKEEIGFDIGKVSLSGELVHFQMKKRNIAATDESVRDIMRIANDDDLKTWEEAKSLQHETMVKAKSISLKMGLQMKIGDVRFQGDKKKATFYYTSDDRVDFRELIKVLASEFKIKIKMHQIGSRQEAGRIGSVGDCGQELCCCSWLTEFKSVTTNTARHQNLTITQSKLSGQCGRLKCCLNYELDNYLNALKAFPENADFIETEKGKAKLQKTDIFKQLMWYSYEDQFRTYPISLQRIIKVLEMNKKGEKPTGLSEMQFEQEKEEVEYENVVGHINISSLEKQKPVKKKKNKRRNRPKRR